MHNCEKTLPKALESINDSDFPHEKIELILVDDGSSDRTLKIAETYASKNNIQTKIFKTNWHGVASARTLILNNANGEFIMWLDSDEALTPTYISKQVEFMEKNPDVAITAGIVAFVPRNLLLNLELTPDIVKRVLFDRSSSFFWKNRRLIGTGGSTFRIKALRQVGGFDSKFKEGSEDIDVVLRIQKLGWQIKINDGVFYEFHNGMSTIVDLLRKYYLYGYSSYQLYIKNKNAFSLFRMTPLPSFLFGILIASKAYKLFYKKYFFLLPFHFSFKMIGWIFGFIHSQRKN